MLLGTGDTYLTIFKELNLSNVLVTTIFICRLLKKTINLVNLMFHKG